MMLSYLRTDNFITPNICCNLFMIFGSSIAFY